LPFEQLVSLTGTQSPFTTRISSRRSAGIGGPSLVQIFSRAGKDLKKIFTPSKNRKNTKIETQLPAAKKEIEALPTGVKFSDLLKQQNDDSHNTTFGVVYANDLAKAELEKENPAFPVGSIIVREKNETATSETPQTVIAMVKREKGFSEKTGDWEFFVFDGKDLKLNSRETIGSCATCHVRAEKTDWVFLDYLK